MTPTGIRDNFDKKIEKIRKMPDLEPELKAMMIDGLEKKKKDAIRAEEAKFERAEDKIDLQYWHNGCPKCGHQFAKEERDAKIQDYLAFREVSNRQ